MKKVLVVDDDPYILMSLEFLMRKAGFDVSIARNGSEALEIIDRNLPALVVLDIMMPDVDGYEICRYIKSDESRKHCKVIFLSAKSKESDLRKGLEIGADDYMTKPFSTRDLVARTKALLSE